MQVTYEDIKNANDSIKTTDIKDKDYAPVSERIKAFRMCYPQGYIITEMKSNEGGVCIFQAIVGYTDEQGNDHTLGTGTAYEKEGSSFINKTSYIENCETSACGRALGMAGFGIGTDIASAEEVQNAELNQVANEKIDDLKVKALTEKCKSDGVNIEELCKLYKVKSLADLKMKKFMNIHENWDKITIGKGKE